MSNFSAENPPDSGYPSVPTLPVWNPCYRKRIFTGSLWTLTDCSLERRGHAVLSMLPVIHQRGQQDSHAIPKPAAESGVRTKAIPATQLTGNFIATSVSICPWNIWDQSRAEPENFQA